jgi:hypothetical protein
MGIEPENPSEPELESWRDLVRNNNEPGFPNILLALEDAVIEAKKDPDAYNKCFVVLFKDATANNNQENNDIITSWFNAGLRFSEIVFLFEYLKHSFIQDMQKCEE